MQPKSSGRTWTVFMTQGGKLVGTATARGELGHGITARPTRVIELEPTLDLLERAVDGEHDAYEVVLGFLHEHGRP